MKMATNKKSFIAYCDWIETFEELDDAEAGRLVKHLFRYVNDLDPQAVDKLTKMTFIPIKQTLKRDLKKHELVVERNRENGAKGGRPKKPTGLFGLNEKPKKADSDSDSDNDNVNEKKEKEVYVCFDHLSITKAECIKLNENYTKKQIDSILEAIQNYKPNKKYTSLYLTAKNWLKKEYGENGIAKEVDPLVAHVKKMTGK
jgi:hypothetical protein